MKKASLFIAALLVLSLFSACTGGERQLPEAGTDREVRQETELILWTYPVGNWGDPTTVGSLLAGFHRQNPNIHISVEYLTYDNGDAWIEQALQDGALPDLVFEGPERLVATWGDQGLMVDISDLWDSDTASMVYDNVRDACRHNNGAYYAFPVCRTAHCMAINYDMFREAGALAYLDEDTRTWTTDGFIKAVQSLREHGLENVGVVYCRDQSGDQGTRALVNNLYGGAFTDDAHTVYTVDSEENIKALQLLHDMEGIAFDPLLSAANAVEQFCRKETAMTFCWNVSLEIQHTINNPDLNFDVFPMSFPADGDDLELPGGIWGFGIFDNGDEERIEAAKCFIRYMTENDEVYKRAVLASTYWPVREMDNIYVNDMLMTEYSVFMPHMGDYYQITPGWPQARAAWWKMLQDVGNGTEISEAVSGFPAGDRN